MFGSCSCSTRNQLSKYLFPQLAARHVWWAYPKKISNDSKYEIEIVQNGPLYHSTWLYLPSCHPKVQNLLWHSCRLLHRCFTVCAISKIQKPAYKTIGKVRAWFIRELLLKTIAETTCSFKRISRTLGDPTNVRYTPHLPSWSERPKRRLIQIRYSR